MLTPLGSSLFYVDRIFLHFLEHRLEDVVIKSLLHFLKVLFSSCHLTETFTIKTLYKMTLCVHLSSDIKVITIDLVRNDHSPRRF